MANKTLPKNETQNNNFTEIDLRNYDFDNLTILSKGGQKQVQDKRYEVYDNIMAILKENKT